MAGRGGYDKKGVQKMSKAELVDLLVSMTRTYDLSSKGYTAIVFNDSQEENRSERPQPSCYPQIYEGGHDKMMDMVKEAYNQILDSRS